MTVAFGPGGPDGERTLVVDGPLDVRRTLAIHRRGPGDPTLRFEPSGSAWRASRTPEGPATLFIEAGDGTIRVRAWGPGSAWALARAGGLVGLEDDPGALVARHRAVAMAVERSRGLRIGRTGVVLECLVPAILEQKVIGSEARRSWTGLVRRYGEDAPGPPGMRLPPTPATLAALPYYAYHPFGIEQRRADLIRSVARAAGRLEALVDEASGPGGDPTRAYSVLRAFPGIGPWTAAEVGIRAFGDADAVSVGDFHLPAMVTWALAGESHGTDERMLELLEPYRGQRGRVLRLLELTGVGPPRRAPRLPRQRFESF
jgi:3-methyladenine DNA glycosylase/8-oxoguanine DNA glycosylase